jgi:ADP-ribosylglycohydrolase
VRGTASYQDDIKAKIEPLSFSIFINNLNKMKRNSSYVTHQNRASSTALVLVVWAILLFRYKQNVYKGVS